MDSPSSQPESSPRRAGKAAAQKSQKSERQDKKAKKTKAEYMPALTQSSTHMKILAAQKRLLKGHQKREERARASVSPKKQAECSGNMGS